MHSGSPIDMYEKIHYLSQRFSWHMKSFTVQTLILGAEGSGGDRAVAGSEGWML